MDDDSYIDNDGMALIELSDLLAAANERIKELEAARDKYMDLADSQTTNLAAERAVSDRLLEDLKDARVSIIEWASYASAYFQEKHDLRGDLARIDAAIAEVEAMRKEQE